MTTIPPSSRHGFFPPLPEGFNAFRAKWYGDQLTAMHQTSLWEGSTAGTESYRFTWLRTWGHPVAIRFDVKGTATTMRYVELDGAGGYAPGGIKLERTRTLSTTEWALVATALQHARFWTLPTSQEDNGQDGLQWFVEGTKDGAYHVVDRWTPSYQTDKRGLREFLTLCQAAFDRAAPGTTFE